MPKLSTMPDGNVKKNTMNVPDTSEKDRFQQKVNEFCIAMNQYENNPFYSNLELVVATLVVSLQMITLVNLFQTYDGTSYPGILATLVLAYIATDFINGFIHMYMDNNTHYNSIVGPYISSFHLHHQKLKSRYKNSLAVYFFESRTKFWLLVYLILLTVLQKLVPVNYNLNVGLVAVGIFSSLAELSHYWCHNATKRNTILKRLQRWGILLSPKHHAHHHRSDNTHYAFLNGVSDPLLNLISNYFYQGYKNKADKHTTAYLKLIQKR